MFGKNNTILTKGININGFETSGANVLYNMSKTIILIF